MGAREQASARRSRYFISLVSATVLTFVYPRRGPRVPRLERHRNRSDDSTSPAQLHSPSKKEVVDLIMLLRLPANASGSAPVPA